MQEPVRSVGGGEQAVKGQPRFEPGDIVYKEKRRRVDTFLIVDIAERGGYTKYRYFRYDTDLFNDHEDSGWYRVDYFDRLVTGETGSHVDYDVGTFYHSGHVTDADRVTATSDAGRYVFSFERLRALLGESVRAIEPPWWFCETVGEGRHVGIREVGWETDGLADDMLRFVYAGQEGTRVDQEANVAEAVNRGLWVPVQFVETELDETVSL